MNGTQNDPISEHHSEYDSPIVKDLVIRDNSVNMNHQYIKDIVIKGQ